MRVEEQERTVMHYPLQLSEADGDCARHSRYVLPQVRSPNDNRMRESTNCQQT